MGEISLAKQVIPRLSKGMLLLADRNYFGFFLWQQAQSTGADLLWRVKKNVRLRVLKRFPDGSFLSAVYEDPTHYRRKEGGISVRVVEYTVKGSDDTYRLVTTILDPELAPAEELATVYTQRWEVETMFDEIKTHIKGPKLTLRSKTADLIEQEFWGLMIAHRVLRSLMHEAALRQNLDPDKISMVHTIRVVKRTMPSRASFSP
jgi:IS4 transposase